MDQIQAKEKVKAMLVKGRISEIYSHTCNSLRSRVAEDGLFPESIGQNGYGQVMFCRTTGAVDALFRQTGDYALDEKVIRFALDSARRMGMRRIPHIAHPVYRNANGGMEQSFSRDDQADGSFHVINAWARLVLTGKASDDFENQYYGDIRDMLNILMNQPYFYYEENCPRELYPHMFPPESLCLVFNCALEHSRENRRWSVFDFLTQCFAGAVLESVTAVARKRGDTKNADFWESRTGLLKYGMERYLTREVDHKKVFLEMRIPDGGWGKPYTGLSWVNLSFVASGWQDFDAATADCTVRLLREKLWMDAPHTGGKKYLCTSIDENGRKDTAILGKAIGWDIVYSLRCGDYDHIREWLEFIEEVNKQDLLAENLIPGDRDWQGADGGNGEQCAWWCWGIACVRSALGLSPAP